jgi:plastin-1
MCDCGGFQFMSMKRESGKLTIGDLPAKMSRLKVVGSDNLTEEERASVIQDLHPKPDDDVDFEFFLKVCSLHLLHQTQLGNRSTR